MKIIKSRKYHKCQKCMSDIWIDTYYFPQRRGKAICFECGRKPKTKTFLTWLTEKFNG